MLSADFLSLRLTRLHENGCPGAVGAGLVPALGAHKGRPYVGLIPFSWQRSFCSVVSRANNYRFFAPLGMTSTTILEFLVRMGGAQGLSTLRMTSRA